ncbi:hypothetical protein ACLB2K_046696 [Fragaria x ananassa]
MSFTLDHVTASFAASLALASGDIIDISHFDYPDKPQPNPRHFLLARTTNSTQVNPDDLQNRLLQRRFRIQARGRDQFIITFDLPKDRNKLVILEEYDGMMNLASIPMNKLYFWVGILNIPKALKKDRYIRNVLTVAGWGGNPNPSSSKVVFPASFPTNRIGFTNASFQFKGSENESTPYVVCGLFDPKPTIRKPIIIRRETILEEANPDSLTVVTIDKGKKVVETLKRGRPSSPTASPKKPKLLNCSTGESPLSSLKKQKTHIPKITARALGLLDEEKSSNSGNGTGVAGKKKIGRPFGSKNTKNFTMEELKMVWPCRLIACNIPSPNSKGKDVL